MPACTRDAALTRSAAPVRAAPCSAAVDEVVVGVAVVGVPEVVDVPVGVGVVVGADVAVGVGVVVGVGVGVGGGAENAPVQAFSCVDSSADTASRSAAAVFAAAAEACCARWTGVPDGVVPLAPVPGVLVAGAERVVVAGAEGAPGEDAHGRHDGDTREGGAARRCRRGRGGSSRRGLGGLVGLEGRSGAGQGRLGVGDRALQRRTVQRGEHLAGAHLVAHGDAQVRHGAVDGERRALLVDPLGRAGEVQGLLHVGTHHRAGAQGVTGVGARHRPGDGRAGDDQGHHQGDRQAAPSPPVLLLPADRLRHSRHRPWDRFRRLWGRPLRRRAGRSPRGSRPPRPGAG